MGKKTIRQICEVTVDDNGKLEEVDAIRASPGMTILFVLSNEHANNTIKVEIKDFKRKETMAAANPFTSGATHVRNLSPGEVDSIKLTLQPKGKFGDPNAGLLPYTTYKYSVVLTDMTAATAAVVYDPDLDVPPA